MPNLQSSFSFFEQLIIKSISGTLQSLSSFLCTPHTAYSLLPWPKEDAEALNSTAPVKLLYSYPTWKLPAPEPEDSAHPECEELKSVTYIRAINGVDYSCLPAAEHQEVIKPAPTPREKRLARTYSSIHSSR